MKKTTSTIQHVQRRAWQRLSKEYFTADLAESRLCCDLNALEAMSIDDLVQLYNQQMTDLLDKHCPVIRVRRRSKQATPWFDADCRAARRHVRAAERRFRRTRSDDDKHEWSDQLTTLKALYKTKCNTYWRSEIDACGGNMKKLWRTLNGVLGEAVTEESEEVSAEGFATFFRGSQFKGFLEIKSKSDTCCHGNHMIVFEHKIGHNSADIKDVAKNLTPNQVFAKNLTWH